MCLHTLIKKLNNTSGYGWKVFKKTTKGYVRGELFYKENYKINKWYAAEHRRLVGIYTKYLSGFHIFKTREGARTWRNDSSRKLELTVKKVKYKQGRLLGTQCRLKIIVADEMKIIE